jgi:hypothetical protein
MIPLTVIPLSGPKLFHIIIFYYVLILIFVYWGFSCWSLLHISHLLKHIGVRQDYNKGKCCLHLLWRLTVIFLFHRCTRFENSGDWVAQVFFPKSLVGSKGFLGKTAKREVPYFGFYYIFLNKSFKICLGGSIFTPLIPLCASMFYLLFILLWINW